MLAFMQLARVGRWTATSGSKSAARAAARAAGCSSWTCWSASLLLLAGVSSRASILVGQVPHSIGLGNMAEKPNLTTSNHSNLQDHLTPTPTTTTLPPQIPPHIATSSLHNNLIRGYATHLNPYCTILLHLPATRRRAASGTWRCAGGGEAAAKRKAPGGCGETAEGQAGGCKTGNQKDVARRASASRDPV